MVTMYTTSWCGYCRRLKDGLNKAGIEYTEVDIEVDESAADIVVSVTGGSVDQVKSKLAA
jgi:mycoredoxin